MDSANATRRSRAGPPGISKGADAVQLRPHKALQKGHDERILALEVPVQEPFAETGLLDNVIHARAAEPLLGKDARGSLHDLSLALVTDIRSRRHVLPPVA